LYLSAVEILGFKSFPFRTRIEFAAGITGVVGPNGCGKTNVLDAIRWVLGEQRTSVLRGAKMEDVIFSGTREVKPLGMAEASITVINNDKRLPTEYSNVTVTRRLHRSGESEYLINNVACRLKDITELFADTGMGANAYSAIELDMVEAILSDKAEQRRQLFDEAAGITKYKLRKRSALRKLDATDNDLLRLADILAEVTSQVNSLRRQMRKAERYRSLTDSIANNELILLKEQYRQTQDDLTRASKEKHDAEICLAQAQAEIDKWELMREDTDSKNAELSDRLRRLRSRLEELSSQYHHDNNELSVTHERIKAAAAADGTDERELAAIGNKIVGLERELEESNRRRADMERSLSELEEKAESVGKTLSEQMALLNEARQSSIDFQRDLFALEGKQSAVEATRDNLQKQIDEVTAELSELQHKRRELDYSRRQAVEKVDSTRRCKTDIEQTLQQTQANAHQAAAAVVVAEQEVEAATVRFAEAQLELKSADTSVGLTRQTIATYEGYGSGVSALLSSEPRIEGLIDTVANVVRPELRYARAIEAGLGEAAEYVLAEDVAAAERAIEYLRDNDLGRVSFLLLDRIQSEANPVEADSGSRAVRATDVVNADPRFQPAMEHLLGKLWIVDDHDAASHMAGQNGCAVVTQSGEYLQRAQIIKGGSGNGAALLGRESRLERLEERLAWARVEMARLRMVMEDARTRRQETIAARDNYIRRTEQLRSELGEIKVVLAEAEFGLKQTEQDRSNTDRATAAAQHRYDSLVNKLDQLKSDFSRLAGDSHGRRDAWQSQEERVEGLERQVNALSDEQEGLRLQVIRTRTEQESLTANINRNQQLAADLLAEKERRSQARVDRAAEVKSLKLRIEELSQALETSSQEQAKVKEEERELSEKQLALAQKHSEYGELVKTARTAGEKARKRHEELLVQETQLQSRRRELAEQLRTKHSIDTATMTLPEPLAQETITELELELEESREKRSQMGMVNMLALEEYDRESQREEFLRRQVDDLTEAKNNLKATINRINTTARKMFIETFQQVRVNFREVFAELFQGGDADIRLEDDGDPLESPILITARPRGKRLLHITQLSGGEKALTAISLLFAIYLVKPSPFCILDEVDAPLDDANVGRFLKLVKSFAENTQFVIITHNKRTMEQCNRLYGVTMEQAGVSQIVSVDFEKLDRNFTPETMTYTSAEPPEIEEEHQSDEPKGLVSADNTEQSESEDTVTVDGADKQSG
jgi:chromosome segregation protein